MIDPYGDTSAGSQFQSWSPTVKPSDTLAHHASIVADATGSWATCNPDLTHAAAMAARGFASNVAAVNAQRIAGLHLAHQAAKGLVDYWNRNPDAARMCAQQALQSHQKIVNTPIESLTPEQIQQNAIAGFDRGMVGTQQSMAAQYGPNTRPEPIINGLENANRDIGGAVLGWLKNNLSPTGIMNADRSIGEGIENVGKGVGAVGDLLGTDVGKILDGEAEKALWHGMDNSWHRVHKALATPDISKAEIQANLAWEQQHPQDVALAERNLGNRGYEQIVGIQQGLIPPAQIMSYEHQATQSIVGFINSEFDNIQHFFRYASLMYQKHGLYGLQQALLPVIAGAGLGTALTMVGAPEVGAALEGGIVGSETAGAGALEASATSGATSGATVPAASESSAVGQTMLGYNSARQAATDFFSPASNLGRVVAGGIRGITQPEIMLGGQIGPQIWHDNQLWNASKTASASLSTLGRWVSKEILGDENTWLSGSIDAIVSLSEAPIPGAELFRSTEEGAKGGMMLANLTREQFIASASRNPKAIRTFQTILDFTKDLGETTTAGESTAAIASRLPEVAGTRFPNVLGQDATNVDQIATAADQIIDPNKARIVGRIEALYPDLGKISPELADLAMAKGATVDSMIEGVADLTEVLGDMKTVRLPTTGLYTLIKKAKLGDSFAARQIGKYFGQMPMYFDEFNQQWANREIVIGDNNSLRAIASMLRLRGVKGTQITDVIGHLRLTNNFKEWENLYINSVQDSVMQSVNRKFVRLAAQKAVSGGFASHDLLDRLNQGNLTIDDIEAIDFGSNGMEQTYQEIYRAAHDNIVATLGNTHAGQKGNFALDLENMQGEGNPSAIWGTETHVAAVLGNQRSPFIIPNYKELKTLTDGLVDMLHDLPSDISYRPSGLIGKNAAKIRSGMSYPKYAAKAVMHGSGIVADAINDYFKRMALLTPGWATRVSMSEIALNASRIGNVNFLAAKVAGGLIKNEARALKATDQIIQRNILDVTEEIKGLRTKLATARKEKTNVAEVLDALNNQIAKREWLRGVNVNRSFDESAANLSDLINDVTPEERAALESIGRNLPVPLKQQAQALNTPQFVQEALKDRNYKVSMTEAENIRLMVRGIIGGTSEAFLRAVGHEEYVRNSAFLVHQHFNTGSFLTSSADSREKYLSSAQDYSRRTTLYDTATDKEGESLDRVIKKSNLENPNFITARFQDDGFVDGWHQGVSAIARDDIIGNPAAKIYLRIKTEHPSWTFYQIHEQATRELYDHINNLPSGVLQTFDRHYAPSWKHPGIDPHASWADVAIRHLESHIARLTPGETLQSYDIKYLPDANSLLTDMANDTVPTDINSFYAKYAHNKKITDLPGTVIARTPSMSGKQSVLAAISKEGHHNVLGPMVNWFSRQPIFVYEFSRARNELEQRVVKGLMSSDQADVLAQTIAGQRIVRFIHNPIDKTRFEEMMGVFAPFYFAQNQAWRRMGRLLTDNPGRFLKYLQIMLGVQRWVSATTNRNGMSVVVIPHLAMYGMPYQASLSGIQTMDPFSPQTDSISGPINFTPSTLVSLLKPSFGPVATVPAKLLFGDSPAGKFIVGPIGTSETTGQYLFSIALPNSIARQLVAILVGSVDPNGAFRDIDNQFVQARIEAIRDVVTNNNRNEWEKITKENPTLTWSQRYLLYSKWEKTFYGDPQLVGPEARNSMDRLISNAGNQAGFAMIAKLGLGLILPTSVTLGNSQGEMYTKYENYLSDPKYKTVGDAMNAFQRDYPWATADTLNKSKSNTQAYYPETKTMFDWLSKNTEFVKNHPLSAIAFAPLNIDSQTKQPYYEPAYQALLAAGLKERETPQQFIDALNIQMGNEYFWQYIHPKYLEETQNKDKDAYTNEQNRISFYGINFNQSWELDFNQNKSLPEKEATLQDFGKVLAENPNIGNTKAYPQTNQALKALYNYTMVNGMDNQGVLQYYSSQMKLGRFSSQSLQEWWQAKMDRFMAANPGTRQAVMSLYYNIF